MEVTACGQRSPFRSLLESRDANGRRSRPPFWGLGVPFWRRFRGPRTPRSSNLGGSVGRGVSRPRRNTTKFDP